MKTIKLILIRLAKVISIPLIIVTMFIIGLSAIINILFWVITGKSFLDFIVKFGKIHLEFAFDNWN